MQSIAVPVNPDTRHLCGEVRVKQLWRPWQGGGVGSGGGAGGGLRPATAEGIEREPGYADGRGAEKAGRGRGGGKP